MPTKKAETALAIHRTASLAATAWQKLEAAAQKTMNGKLTLFAYWTKYEFSQKLVSGEARNHRLVRVIFCKEVSKKHVIGFFSASPGPNILSP